VVFYRAAWDAIFVPSSSLSGSLTTSTSDISAEISMVALTRGVASAAFPLDRPFAIIAPYRGQKTAYGQGERNACAKFGVRGHGGSPLVSVRGSTN